MTALVGQALSLRGTPSPAWAFQPPCQFGVESSARTESPPHIIGSGPSDLSLYSARLNSSSSFQRALMEHGNFRITLDRAMPFGDPLEDEIPRDGGYAITHVGVVERIDGSALSLKDSEPVLDCLGHYLSFCRGSWTYPVLLCAEDTRGSVVGQRWELSNTIDRYKQTGPWLPRNEPVGAHMSEAFRGYADAWFSALWGDAIRIGTQWYVESSTGAVEKSIILTQAALELLAWMRLVEDTHALSKKVSKSMPFAEKLRQLLQSCSVPLSVPAKLDQLLAYSKALRVSDGPEALTRLRNALVHPSPSKRKRLQEHPRAVVDAWVMGLLVPGSDHPLRLWLQGQLLKQDGRGLAD